MSNFEELFSAAAWEPINTGVTIAERLKAEADGVPYATHRGIIKIAGLELECFQLSTGDRIVTEESIVAFLRCLET